MAATLARAASFGNPDEPPEGAVNVTNPNALTTPGPHDAMLANTQPEFLNPSPTDVGSMPEFWASFNLASRRVQNGGWGRQVTQSDFAISTEIAGGNMRLHAGRIREVHWPSRQDAPPFRKRGGLDPNRRQHELQGLDHNCCRPRNGDAARGADHALASERG
jgi:hypothetical protein